MISEIAAEKKITSNEAMRIFTLFRLTFILFTTLFVYVIYLHYCLHYIFTLDLTIYVDKTEKNIGAPAAMWYAK